jgi:hypothetical protein
MKHLEPFEFTPAYQVKPEDPVTFTLKPLDVRGRYEIKAGVYVVGDEVRIRWEGASAAARYITGWKGGGIKPYSRTRPQQIIDGVDDADDGWEFWLSAIAFKLLAESEPSEDASKKS